MLQSTERTKTEQYLLDQLLEVLTIQSDLVKMISHLMSENKENKLSLSALESFVVQKGLSHEFAEYVQETLQQKQEQLH